MTTVTSRSNISTPASAFMVADLLAFNLAIIEQAEQVISVLQSTGNLDRYGEYVGPHLRHILEHYEALLLMQKKNRNVVNYDERERDRSLENEPKYMLSRLQSLTNAIKDWDSHNVSQPIAVCLKGGLSGELEFITNSTLGRELMFLASHAVHHFALVQVWCLQHGIRLSADFGKAPATVAYEQDR